MITKPVLWEVLKVTIGVFALGALMLLVFLICGWFDITCLFGALLGCGYASVNFLLTAVSVSKSVEAKSENAAKLKMMNGYYIRLALAAAVIFWAIKAPYFNMWAAVVPFIFPRMVIYVINFIKYKKEGKNNEC